MMLRTTPPRWTAIGLACCALPLLAHAGADMHARRQTAATMRDASIQAAASRNATSRATTSGTATSCAVASRGATSHDMDSSHPPPQQEAPPRLLVIVSANAEWTPAKALLKPARVERSPYGEFFTHRIGGEPVLFLHGGWGKIAAAASAEYAIARWRPEVVINLGTCGGIAGRVARFDRLLVTRTIVYDIQEAMGDSAAAIADYSTDIDLTWLDAPPRAVGSARTASSTPSESPASSGPTTSSGSTTSTTPAFPLRVQRAPLLSGDRDLVPAAVSDLMRRFPEAVAADWESGAIAYVAARRQTRLLILRGVSDLVSPTEGEAAGNAQLFVNNAAETMRLLLDDLRALVPHIDARLPQRRPRTQARTPSQPASRQPQP